MHDLHNYTTADLKRYGNTADVNDSNAFAIESFCKNLFILAFIFCLFVNIDYN